MSFQGYQGEVNSHVGHEITGAEEGAQMMQLTQQLQLAQIVNSAVSQVLTQHVQPTAGNPPLAVAASTAVVQQDNPPPILKSSRLRVMVQ